MMTKARKRKLLVWKDRSIIEPCRTGQHALNDNALLKKSMIVMRCSTITESYSLVGRTVYKGDQFRIRVSYDPNIGRE
jgi:hypothetical protein